MDMNQRDTARQRQRVTKKSCRAHSAQPRVSGLVVGQTDTRLARHSPRRCEGGRLDQHEGSSVQ